MKKIENVIKSGSSEEEKPKKLFNANCHRTLFEELFLKTANKNIHFSQQKYIVDDLNKHTINQLYYYLNHSNKFDGDLNKGILLIGAIGSGKSLIMEAFIEVFNETSNKHIASLSSREVVDKARQYNLENYYKIPLYIDDIGKEQITSNNYGTIVTPFEDLISERYRNGSLTLGTSNLTLSDMPYGQHCIDRMKQKLNVLELPGRSRRN